MLNDDILNAVDKAVNTTSTDVDFGLTNLAKQKYISSTKKVGNILFSLGNRFRVLNVGGKKVFSYRTLYFDTWNCCFFNEYLNESPLRHKVRLRETQNGNRCYFEVKVSDSTKNQRLKQRIAIESWECFKNNQSQELLKKGTGLTFDQITPILGCQFKRIVLIDDKAQQRVSIDLSPVFINPSTGVNVGVPELVIIETKRNTENADLFAELIDSESAQKSDISRYMTGMLATNPSTKRYTVNRNHSK